MSLNINTVNAVFGARGTGKTEYAKGNAAHNVKGIIPVYLRKGMKVLIVDTIDHPSWRDVPTITAAGLKKWGTSDDRTVRRIFVSTTDMPRLNKVINTSVWNGLIIYEDAYKHQSEALDQPIIELIGDSKQKNVDIIFMYHTWMHAPLDLYRYLDNIEVFKTKDSPEARKKTIQQAGYWDEAMEVYNEVRNHESRFFHKTISTGL